MTEQQKPSDQEQAVLVDADKFAVELTKHNCVRAVSVIIDWKEKTPSTPLGVIRIGAFDKEDERLSAVFGLAKQLAQYSASLVGLMQNALIGGKGGKEEPGSPGGGHAPEGS